MKIPAYWSHGTVEESDADGKLVSTSCWRSSDQSPQHAHESALSAARRILRNYLTGGERNRYAYGSSPLREEVIQRFTNSQGELTAAITQNAYGSLVLNTARVMFIDLDFPPVSPGEQLRAIGRRWFKKKASPSPDAEREASGLARLQEFIAGNPQWNVRIYRTCAGLRALVTHALFDPTAEAAHAAFAAVEADPLYVRLCKSQECFRARLTPKPWRCGHANNTIRWPCQTEKAQSEYDAWKAQYIERQSNYATCRLIESTGSGVVAAEVEPIIAVHDQVTRCDAALPLA